MKKRTTLLGILITIGLLLYSYSGTVAAVGQVPPECLQSSLSTANPRHDPACNPQCTSNNCITYCKGGSTGAKIEMPKRFTKYKIVYRVMGKLHIYLTIPELNIKNRDLYCNDHTCSGVIYINGLQIAQNQSSNNTKPTLTIKLSDHEGYELGFRAPSGNNMCGETNICSPIGGTYNAVSIANLVNTAKNGQYSIISKECWGDSPIGNADFDFNDNQIVISGFGEFGPYCGNGIVEKGEECDDGNRKNGDGCSSTCQKEAVCGNGIVEKGEQCDDGNTKNGDGCSSTCQKEAVCGNGIVEKGEQCDDGNTKNGDGCSSTCQKEAVCGNGVVEKGEQCDDGNTKNGDGCSSTCQKEAVCGNGIVEKGEGCDDGNTKNGDGCSSTCKVEVKPQDTAGGILTFIGHIVMQVINFFAKLF